MKIKSCASPSELSSPFYKANENFCADFETYISSKQGFVKGQYNAWAYLVYGKFKSSKPWKLMYKKSTITSTGSIFLPKDQSLLILATWKTKLSDSKGLNFTIRRRKMLDFIRILFKKSTTVFNIEKSYTLDSNKLLSNEIYTMMLILKPLFGNQKIYRIQLNNNELLIDFDSKEHHFDFLDEIILQLT